MLSSVWLNVLCWTYNVAAMNADTALYGWSTPQIQLNRSPSEGCPINFTSSSPHIFSSLRSLLRQWPNTFFPNGHSIIPCEIASFTNLYHGRWDVDLPPNPEWFAFDIEMSYGIMGSGRNAHMLTYQTVKPVQCLYFDGMSASLEGTGQLDSQMVFLCGNVYCHFPSGDWQFLGDEYGRARGLCTWILDHNLGGSGWGVEGIVRMNAGFELIWCNFSSPSIRLISHLNITAPLLPYKRWIWDEDDGFIADNHIAQAEQIRQRSLTTNNSWPPLPSSTAADPHATPHLTTMAPYWQDSFLREPFLLSGYYEWYRSATWHYGTSGMGPGLGENRVKLKTCGFMSYYDPMFRILATASARCAETSLNLTTDGRWKGPGLHGNRSLALRQLARRRRRHTLAAIDPQEARLMNSGVLRGLQDQSSAHEHCTGIDWVSTASDITTRYSSALSQLILLLSNAPRYSNNATTLKHFLSNVRGKTHALIMPFFEYPPRLFSNTSGHRRDWTLGSTMGKATFTSCKYAYTDLLYDDKGHRSSFIGPNEVTIIKAVEDVLSAICSTTIETSLSVEYEWQSRFNSANENLKLPSSSSEQLLYTIIQDWVSKLEELVAYLGWASDSVRCEKLCGHDEYCLIPMWPLPMFRNRGQPRLHRNYPGYKDNHSVPRRKSCEVKSGTSPPHCDPSVDPWPDLEEYLWHPQCFKFES